MNPETYSALVQSLRYMADTLERESVTAAQPQPQPYQPQAAPEQPQVVIGGMGPPPTPAQHHIDLQVPRVPQPQQYQAAPEQQYQPQAAPEQPQQYQPQPQAAPAQPAPDQGPPRSLPEPGATMEDVHRLIGRIAQTADDGLQGRLAQLIASYGATAISRIDPAHYPELMAKAKEMANVT